MMAVFTLENLSTVKKKGMEDTSSPMVISMTDNSNPTSSMALDAIIMTSLAKPTLVTGFLGPFKRISRRHISWTKKVN